MPCVVALLFDTEMSKSRFDGPVEVRNRERVGKCCVRSKMGAYIRSPEYPVQFSDTVLEQGVDLCGRDRRHMMNDGDEDDDDGV